MDDISVFDPKYFAYTAAILIFDTFDAILNSLRKASNKRPESEYAVCVSQYCNSRKKIDLCG
jgi:aminoglycoside phosphotransferase